MKWWWTLIPCLLLAKPPPTHQGQMLYLMRSGNKERAIDAYRAYCSFQGEQDFDLLHELAWGLIEEGTTSEDEEILLLSLFGATLTTEEQALPYLLRALQTKDPKVQLAAINFLSKMNHDIADKEFTVGMASNELLIRLETLHMMAQKKMKATSLQAESLMTKIPKELHPIFPPLFAMTADAPSLKRLRRFLSDPDDRVRASAIHSVEMTQRDEFLPVIRRLTKHTNPLIQEAASSCLGTLKDEKGKKDLQRLSKSEHLEVRTQALRALYLLDDQSAKIAIFEEAKQGNPFAFALLGDIEGYEDFLAFQLTHPDKVTRYNAALALLERRDPRCLQALCELLVRQTQDLALVPQASPGKSLHFWKPITSTTQKAQENPQLMEQILRSKEILLAKAFDLEEVHYLKLAKVLFDANEKPLIPTLVLLLEKSGSSGAVELLKGYHDKVGAPLVRQMCTLALYRLEEPGPYKQELYQFVKDWKNTELIRFRPLIPQSQDLHTTYQLTPEEISRMLVESLEALVAMHDGEAIELILEAIQYGHPKNRYALAGILVRATM